MSINEEAFKLAVIDNVTLSVHEIPAITDIFVTPMFATVSMPLQDADCRARQSCPWPERRVTLTHGRGRSNSTAPWSTPCAGERARRRCRAVPLRVIAASGQRGRRPGGVPGNSLQNDVRVDRAWHFSGACVQERHRFRALVSNGHSRSTKR